MADMDETPDSLTSPIVAHRGPSNLCRIARFRRIWLVGWNWSFSARASSEQYRPSIPACRAHHDSRDEYFLSLSGLL